MAENMAAFPQTNHVDVKYHSVQKFVVDEFLKVIFVRTVDNKADIFTKNVN